MADLKITNMTSLAAGTIGADVLHIIDDPTGTPINKKVTVSDMLNALAAPVTLAVGALTLTEALHAGRMCIVPDQTSSSVITLPTPKAGMVITFTYGGAAADAQNTAIQPAGDGFFSGSLLHADVNGNTFAVVVSDNAADDLLTLVTPANFTVVCTGVSTTEWHLSGFVSSDAAPTIA